MELKRDYLERIVAAAIEEDIGSGDVTCAAVTPPEARAAAILVVRAAGVVAGLQAAEETFRQTSPDVLFRARLSDGAPVEPGALIAEVNGPAQALLKGERVALNFLQRLSGIATLTRRCVEAVRGHDVRIMDTRKTTPGLRALEKYAVRVGGGTNHRMGLYDQVLIKDNHLRLSGASGGGLSEAVRRAVKRARQAAGDRMRIEVETETMAMVEAALEAGADIIMLDNMDEEAMKRAAALVRAERARVGSDYPITEASGGITLERLRAVAATGVDAISLGALTHSAPALDIAMEIA